MDEHCLECNKREN